MMPKKVTATQTQKEYAKVVEKQHHCTARISNIGETDNAETNQRRRSGLKSV